MWEAIKSWFASNDFAWFMCGYFFALFIEFPNIFNLLMFAFWVWVLSTDN